MGKQNHIVQKLTVEIGLATQGEAYGIQSKISTNYERLLLNTMSEIFDRLIGEDEVVQIDKLEINLGTISAEQMDYEFPEKIKKEIECALTKLLYEIRQSPGKVAYVRMDVGDGNSMNVRANVQQKSYSLLESLFYFLEYGVLPWTEEKKEKPALRFLVAEAMEKHPEQLRQILQQLSNKAYVFRRLAFQLPEEQLQYLAAILGSGFSSKLILFSRELERWIETFLKQAGNVLNSGRSVSSVKMKQFFWEETLRYFSSNAAEGNVSVKQESSVFLAEMLNKIILRFEIKVSGEALKKTSGKFENDIETAVKKLATEITEIELQQGKGAAENSKQVKSKKSKANSEEAIERERKEKQGERSASVQQEGRQKEIERIAKAKEAGEYFPETPEVEKGIYIGNAGLVILSPYIAGFLRNLGFVNGNEFINDESKWRAVHLLQWLVDGDGNVEEEKPELSEHDLVLNKLICGIDLAEPVPVILELTEMEKKEGTELLEAVIENWTIIKNSSIATLRSTFLQKEGRLKKENEDDWGLLVNRDSGVEMLIDRLPWGISVMKMPWNKGIINVQW